ncbi:hypothetical protein CR513_57788, partial [Mucuna pruriens]
MARYRRVSPPSSVLVSLDNLLLAIGCYPDTGPAFTQGSKQASKTSSLDDVQKEEKFKLDG